MKYLKYSLLSVCVICALVALFFDIAFMETGLAGYKYAYWISMLLASTGNICLAVILWKKQKKDQETKQENYSE